MSTDLIPGYDSTLIWGETKNRLQAWRKRFPDQTLVLERRLATACIEYCLAHADTHPGVVATLKEIIRVDTDICVPDIDAGVCAPDTPHSVTRKP